VTSAPSNFPKHLQNLRRDNDEHLDLAAVDIFRDRERGVPRYNQFRRLLHKDPVKSFEELTDNAVWREEIRRVYGNDLEKVDRFFTDDYRAEVYTGFGLDYLKEKLNVDGLEAALPGSGACPPGCRQCLQAVA